MRWEWYGGLWDEDSGIVTSEEGVDDAGLWSSKWSVKLREKSIEDIDWTDVLKEMLRGRGKYGDEFWGNWKDLEWKGEIFFWKYTSRLMDIFLVCKSKIVYPF